MWEQVNPGDRRHVRVFISYAHDSDEHREAVRRLYTHLRTVQGIDAMVDLADGDRPQEWSAWIDEQFDQAAFVLVIASPQYVVRAADKAPAGQGRGVRYEASRIRDAFYQDPKEARRRFLPVVLPGGSAGDLPGFMSPGSSTVYRIARIDDGDPELRRLASYVKGERGPAPPTLAPLHQGLTLAVRAENGELITTATLSGSPLGEWRARLPTRSPWIAHWSVAEAEKAMAEAGHELGAAVLGPATARTLTDLVDRSGIGEAVDITIAADGRALELPFELMRLPDGRLLSTLGGVCLVRRLAQDGDPDRHATPPLAGPLKILAAVATPDETRTASRPLDIEREMQAIVDSIGAAGQQTPARVRILEVAHPEQITEALKADQFHVLHLSARGSADGLELEDEDGNAVPVGIGKLIDMVKAARRPLPLIVLSSCAGAAPADGDSLAVSLVRNGADRVLAMQAAVSDAYATELARLFYRELAVRGVSPGVALADARRTLEERRLDRRRAGVQASPEYGVATLICAAADTRLVDPGAPAEELSRFAQPSQGQGVHQLSLGQLIGRRPQLRAALNVLRRAERSLEEHGACVGAALCGIGGIGKSALASRVMGRMREEGWLVGVHAGQWNPQRLIDGVAAALEGQEPFAWAAKRLRAHEIADQDKVAVVVQLLAAHPLLLVFDDFEQNLSPDGSAFSDPGFEEVFQALCDAVGVGGLLVTCRYPIPGMDALVRVDVPPLSTAELGRLLLRHSKLRDLGSEDRKNLMRTIGGHPRLIEFVDALLRSGRSTLAHVNTKIRDLAREHGLSREGASSLDEAAQRALRLASRDVLLAELVALLTDDERETLLQAAVTLVPMAIDDLTVAVHGESPSLEATDTVRAAAERLTDLTLLTRPDPAEVVIHTWVAEALRPYQVGEEATRRRRAIPMRLARIQSGRGGLDDLLDIAHHLIALDDHVEAVNFSVQAADFLAATAGQLSVASFLGEVTPSMHIHTPNYLHLSDLELTALILTGNVTAAGACAERYTSAASERLQADPDNAQAQRDLSISLNNVGNVAVAAGDLPAARQAYQTSHDIAARLAQADPGNAQAQRDLSVSLDNVGDVAVTAGDLPAARQAYQQGLDIAARLAQADPDNAQAQRDLSISLNKVGNVAVAAGDLAAARTAYHESHTIRARLAHADPGNAQAQRDLSISLNNVGDVAVAAGDLPAARTAYHESHTILTRLAHADPDNAQAQRDLSISLEKVGNAAVAAGDLPAARQAYQQGLDIAERLAHADPDNAQAQRDLSVSLEKVGNAAVAAGDLPAARQAYQQGLDIAERLAHADPDNAQAQRDLSISLNNVGDVAVAAGDLPAARQAYQTSHTILTRLAHADPDNAQAQRDLSISLNNVGDVAVAAGDLPAARTAYHESHTILTRLAHADPDNAQAQRDLSVSPWTGWGTWRSRPATCPPPGRPTNRASTSPRDWRRPTPTTPKPNATYQSPTASSATSPNGGKTPPKPSITSPRPATSRPHDSATTTTTPAITSNDWSNCPRHKGDAAGACRLGIGFGAFGESSDAAVVLSPRATPQGTWADAAQAHTGPAVMLDRHPARRPGTP
ncbi:CHAT domain-containing protein [Microbispora sp. NPDC049125]|uniref:CHAT domain-containing protein n=1 Tax=Microbispora sp. NPDC049125 TaxID=3154929 RepID=UPI003466EE87